MSVELVAIFLRTVAGKQTDSKMSGKHVMAGHGQRRMMAQRKKRDKLERTPGTQDGEVKN